MRRAVIAVALVALGCGACTSTAPDPDPSAPAATTASASPSSSAEASGSPTAKSVDAVDWAGGVQPPVIPPLEVYRFSDTESEAVNAAWQVRIGECMARFGFTVTPEPAELTASKVGPQFDTYSRLYGITDSELAAREGYGVGEDPLTPPTSSVEESAAYQLTMSGMDATGHPAEESVMAAQQLPVGGCATQAYQSLGMQTPEWVAADELLSQLRYDAEYRSQQEPEVLAVFAEWSQCLAGAGFTATDPFTAGEEFEGDPDRPSEREKQMAVQDIACKQETDLVTIWNQVNVRLEQEAIEANQLALDEQLQRKTAALKAVAQVTVTGA